MWVAQDQAGHEPLVGIVSLARRQQVPVQLKSPEALAGAARTSAPQGVVAWAQPVERCLATPRAELPGAGAGPPAFLLVLDGVTDPGNFGSLLRSAACAGATGVVIARHRSAPLTPAALKSAAGAVEKVPIAVVAGIPRRPATAGQSRGLDGRPRPRRPADLWQTIAPGRARGAGARVRGGGISHLVRQRCDVLARIPQSGAVESLNVAAAGAVACFEVARRRAGTAGQRRRPSLSATAPTTARASVGTAVEKKSRKPACSSPIWLT